MFAMTVLKAFIFPDKKQHFILGKKRYKRNAKEIRKTKNIAMILIYKDL